MVTPFYVESGGQVSDTGVIEGDGWTVDIEDARQPIGGLIVHSGEVVEGIAGKRAQIARSRSTASAAWM